MRLVNRVVLRHDVHFILAPWFTVHTWLFDYACSTSAARLVMVKRSSSLESVLSTLVPCLLLNLLVVRHVVLSVRMGWKEYRLRIHVLHTCVQRLFFASFFLGFTHYFLSLLLLVF